MRAMKLLAVVMGLVAAGSCGADDAAGRSKAADDAQQVYKNHRTSKNDTAGPAQTLRHKYPVYPAQVYADLSNAWDFTTARTADVSARTTEVPADEVRVFITPSGGAAANSNKRRPDGGTTPVAASSPAGSSPPQPSVYFVTAKNATVQAADNSSSKTQVYSPRGPSASQPAVGSSSSSAAVRADNVDSRGVLPPALSTSDESTKRKLNGTKIRRVLNTQQEHAQPTTLLSASSTTAPPQQQQQQQTVVVTQPRNAAAVATKVANSSGASKPFATVLVPKQMLEGDNNAQQPDYSSAFRPIAAPAFASYGSAAAVDTNAVVPENRRTSSGAAAAGKTQAVKASAVQQRAAAGGDVPTGGAGPKLTGTKYGFTKPSAYKVQEEYGPGDGRASVVYDKRFGGDGGHKHDQTDQPVFVPAERRHVQKPEIKYGFTVPETVFGFEQRQPQQPYVVDRPPPDAAQLQFRENYPARDAAVSYSKYNSAGKIEMRPPATVEMAAGPPFETNNRPFEANNRPFEVDNRPSSGPPKDFGRAPGMVQQSDESSKDVLKSLLLDILKSKQQSETTKTPRPYSMDDTFDSYFKTSRPNVDYSLDSYDIETDMSCNLRSTKYITDGQCVTTKPIVEAVCADRCLVYASSQSLPFGVQRSSPSANQQVEALHCVDGDVKLVRVQLHCRDGNTLNNVVKVVTNCRCKLHQIQPQMRSNIPTM